MMNHKNRQYIENTPVLDITALNAKHFLTADRNGQSTCSNRWGVLWAFNWHISHDLKQITASYARQNKGFTHTATLNHQSVNFGGSRAFLNCSECGKNRKQLFIANHALACRECHNLHYKSQSESPNDRKYRRLDRLLTNVHNFGYRFDGHWKLKGQHWKTYQQLDKEISLLQESIFVDISNKFAFGKAARHF